MKITNKYNLPESFVKMATTDYKVTPKRYSATQLLDSTRACILKRRHNDELEEDVSDLIFALFGQLSHAILERTGGGESDFTEEKLITPIKDTGYYLSGIFDLFSPEEKLVTDYKTCSVWKVTYGNYDDWKKQLLMYAWQLKHIGFEVKQGQIIAIMRDWQKSKAKFDKSYPQHQAVKIVFNFTKKDFEEIEDWIFERFQEIISCEELSDDKLPLCTAEERFNSGDKYAVMKKGRKRALRVFDMENDAKKFMEIDGDYIEKRQGEDKKCLEYCSVAPFCSYYKEKYLRRVE